jgi:galactokinase
VLPAAIDRDVALVAAPRDDRRLRLHSLTVEESVELDLDALRPAGQWHDYVAGVAAALMGADYAVRGLDATLDGTVPLGGGLSSSAALEVAAALALARGNGLDVPPREVALLCQRAENEFVGARVGIMDQFISLFGRRDRALLLDCRSLATELVPLPLREAGLVCAVCDSGVKHALAGGEYNRRRQECAEAVEVLRASYPDIGSLRDVTPAMLDAAAAFFDPAPDAPSGGHTVAGRRARHVVTENARVLETVAAIRAGDWARVGAALGASHASLRDDYEVSVPEIDALVELARGVDGVLGARLMGGGFGGSTLTLLRRDALDRFTATVAAGYRARTGREATIYPVEIVDGARVAPLGEEEGEA